MDSTDLIIIIKPTGRDVHSALTVVSINYCYSSDLQTNDYTHTGPQTYVVEAWCRDSCCDFLTDGLLRSLQCLTWLPETSETENTPNYC